MSETQDAVTEWHRRTFSMPRLAALGLKLAEEAGELAKAINLWEHTEHGDLDNLRDEIGDVAIVLMVIAARVGSEFDGLIAERAEEVMARERKVGSA